MMGQKKSLSNILKVFNKTVTEIDGLLAQNGEISKTKEAEVQRLNRELESIKKESVEAAAIRAKLAEFTTASK